MDISGISGGLSNANIDSSFDVTSALKSKYSSFLNVFSEMSTAMANNTTMIFPDFPNKPVSPADTSFSLYANYSMNQFEQQLQTLMDAEKWKTTADKQMIQAMG